MNRRAVVLGAGVAGLMAARALQEQFEEVVIVDRDELDDVSDARAGVAQGRHTHVLLQGGAQVMNRFFPGFCAELIRHGAVHADATEDCIISWNGVFRPRFRSGLSMHLATRPFLEQLLRRRVAALPNLRLMPQQEVVELLHSERKIHGVKLRSRSDSTQTELGAVLVVDATGRDSKAATWLQSAGFAEVPETVVQPHLGYASRLYRAPKSADFKIAALFNLAPMTRGGSLIEVEGNRWSVVLAGTNGDYPSTDESQYLDFARSLPHPFLYECLKNAEPLTPVVGFRRTENRWKHFESMPIAAAGFLVLGDAMCALNPFYGQGMTVSSLQAEALMGLLKRVPAAEHSGAAFAQRFQKTAAKIADLAWSPAIGLDLAFAKTEGPKLKLAQRIQKAMGDRVLARTATDPKTCKAFFSLLHMIVSPTVLLKPAVLWGMVRGPEASKLMREPQRSLPVGASTGLAEPRAA